MGRKKSIDKLTPLVLEYGVTHDDNLIAQLIKESSGLIYVVMKYYRMDYFPGLIQEEVVGACKSIILLKAIKGFDAKKGRFSTYYTWKLKSFIKCKQKYFLRRKKLLEHLSIDEKIPGAENMTLADFMHNFDLLLKQKLSAKMAQIFNL